MRYEELPAGTLVAVQLDASDDSSWYAADVTIVEEDGPAPAEVPAEAPEDAA